MKIESAVRFLILSVFTFSFLHCEHVLVDTVNPICQQEHAYNSARADYSYRAMQSFLQQNISTKPVPTVACCLSGGGYRAMISSTAFFQAIEDIGLLAATKYVSSLSGSTWALASMLARDSHLENPLTVQQFGVLLKSIISDVSFFNPRTLHSLQIFGKIAELYLERKIIEPSDFWGAVLIDRLLYDMHHNGVNVQAITFESVRKLLGRSLKYPFPIFTASIDNFLPYKWVEVNPFVSGGDFLMSTINRVPGKSYSGAYIPTSALGSYFNHGVSVMQFNELSVGSMIGIFGSPYSLSLADIIKFAEQEAENYLAYKIPQAWERRIIDGCFAGFTDYFCTQKHLNTPRFLPTNIYNFLYAMDSSLKDLPKIILSDAGFDQNLPVLALLKKERNVNVILVCDASSDATWKDHPEISRIRETVIHYGYKFPLLSNGQKINENIIVYQDSDPSVPTVVYFTNAVNESTLKFDYTSGEFDELYVFMYNLVINNKKLLQDVILNKTKGLELLRQAEIDNFVVVQNDLDIDLSQVPDSAWHFVNGYCGLL